jgi:hypothetical protein
VPSKSLIPSFILFEAWECTKSIIILSPKLWALLTKYLKSSGVPDLEEILKNPVT